MVRFCSDRIDQENSVLQGETGFESGTVVVAGKGVEAGKGVVAGMELVCCSTVNSFRLMSDCSMGWREVDLFHFSMGFLGVEEQMVLERLMSSTMEWMVVEERKEVVAVVVVETVGTVKTMILIPRIVVPEFLERRSQPLVTFDHSDPAGSL